MKYEGNDLDFQVPMICWRYKCYSPAVFFLGVDTKPVNNITNIKQDHTIANRSTSNLFSGKNEI